MSGLAYFVDPASVERAVKRLARLRGLTDEASRRAIMTDEAPERQSAPGAALYADGWIAMTGLSRCRLAVIASVSEAIQS